MPVYVHAEKRHLIICFKRKECLGPNYPCGLAELVCLDLPYKLKKKKKNWGIQSAFPFRSQYLVNIYMYMSTSLLSLAEVTGRWELQSGFHKFTRMCFKLQRSAPVAKLTRNDSICILLYFSYRCHHPGLYRYENYCFKAYKITHATVRWRLWYLKKKKICSVVFFCCFSCLTTDLWFESFVEY